MTKYSQDQIDRYRDVHVDGWEWWRDTYDEYKQIMRRQGFEISDINFSGFYSQGDGASFTGYVHNLPRFLTFATGSTHKFPLWRKLFERNEVMFFVRDIGGNYSHEYSVSSDFNVGGFLNGAPCDMDDALYAIYTAWDEVINDEMLTVETILLDYCREWMRRLYCELEREYEYLTSDEFVIEWMEANDIAPDVEDEAA